MREETKRKFMRALWMRRLKWAGAGLAVLCVIGGLFVLTSLDSEQEVRRVPGVITRIGPLNATSTQAIEKGLAVDVRLDDGRQAHVMVLKTSNPQIGEHVQISEHHTRLGRTTFTWK